MTTTPPKFGLPPRGRHWHRESVALGHQLAVLYARGGDRPPISNLTAARRFYEDKFGGSIPQVFSEQLVWAERYWPELFTKLLKRNVLPLDICSYSGSATAVELVQKELEKSRSWEGRLHAIRDSFGYLTKNPFGARLLRGLSDYMGYIERRPELGPCARPSQALQILEKASKSRVQSRHELRMQEESLEKSSGRRPFHQPGHYCLASAKDHPRSKETNFSRRCWGTFQDVPSAVQYLLSGGESASQVRMDPYGLIYRCVRKVNSNEGRDYLYKYSSRFVSDGWGARHQNKYFVSVTTNRDYLSGFRVHGNLSIHIKTTRAFPLPFSLGEEEHGIPFIINPSEVYEAELRLSHSTWVIGFHWNEDYTFLEVIAHNYVEKKTCRLQYHYNALEKNYTMGPAIWDIFS